MAQAGVRPEPLLQPPLVGYLGRRAEVRLTSRCDSCGKQVVLESFQAREWVRVGPLPICPLQAYRVFDRCPLCHHQRRLPLASYLAWTEAELAPDLARLSLAPDDVDLRLALAWRAYGLGRPHLALALLTPLLLEESLPAAHHAAGVVCRCLGRHDEAVRAFQAATTLAPGTALYHYDHGRQLMRRRSTLGLAELQLMEAAQSSPTDPAVWVALARTRTWRGNWEGAAAAWHRCAALDDPSGAALVDRASLARVERRLFSPTARPA